MYAYRAGQEQRDADPQQHGGERGGAAQRHEGTPHLRARARERSWSAGETRGTVGRPGHADTETNTKQGGQRRNTMRTPPLPCTRARTRRTVQATRLTGASKPRTLVRRPSVLRETGTVIRRDNQVNHFISSPSIFSLSFGSIPLCHSLSPRVRSLTGRGWAERRLWANLTEIQSPRVVALVLAPAPFGCASQSVWSSLVALLVRRRRSSALDSLRRQPTNEGECRS